LNEGENVITFYVKDGTGNLGQYHILILREKPFYAPDNVDLIPFEGRVMVTWGLPDEQDLPDITGFGLFRSKDNGEFVWIANTTRYHYYDLEVSDLSSYTYQLFAYKKDDVSPGSVLVTGSSLPVSQFTSSVVNNLKIDSEGNGVIVISWDKPDNNGGSDIIYYRIYRKETDQEWKLIGLHTKLSDLSFIDESVQNGIQYSYYVTAVNNIGEGGTSNIVVGTPNSENVIPNSPIITKISLEKDGDVRYILLTWDKPISGKSEITHYNIYRSTSDDLADRKLIAINYDLDHADVVVEEDITYYYQVSAVNSDGESFLSEVSEITVTSEPNGIPFSFSSMILGLIVVSALNLYRRREKRYICS
jgi:fibronectin type 3 domain-containing protein